jgi:hypothetical protein
MAANNDLICEWILEFPCFYTFRIAHKDAFL